MTWLFEGILFTCALVVPFANDTTRARINNIPSKSHVIPLLILLLHVKYIFDTCLKWSFLLPHLLSIWICQNEDLAAFLNWLSDFVSLRITGQAGPEISTSIAEAPFQVVGSLQRNSDLVSRVSCEIVRLNTFGKCGAQIIRSQIVLGFEHHERLLDLTMSNQSFSTLLMY